MSKTLTRILSRPYMRKFNDRLLTSALKARGYDNFRNQTESGERFFVEKVLAKKKPLLCFDVGANVGSYTEALLSKTNARVVSFEPLPTPRATMAHLSDLYQHRLEIVAAAVGKTDGQAEIFYSNERTAHASMKSEVSKVSYVENSQSMVVSVRSLDAYCTQHDIKSIDFVKIDTEGGELDVINGAQNLLRSGAIRTLQIEFNLHQMYLGVTMHSISEALKGYRLYQMTEFGLAKRDPNDPLSNIFMFSNFIFSQDDLSEFCI